MYNGYSNKEFLLQLKLYNGLLRGGNQCPDNAPKYSNNAAGLLSHNSEAQVT